MGGASLRFLKKAALLVLVRVLGPGQQGDQASHYPPPTSSALREVFLFLFFLFFLSFVLVFELAFCCLFIVVFLLFLLCLTRYVAQVDPRFVISASTAYLPVLGL